MIKQKKLVNCHHPPREMCSVVLTMYPADLSTGFTRARFASAKEAA